jgi:signal transduction histidine kinase
MIDKLRVQGILINLITNAIKFSKQGQKILVIATYSIISHSILKLSIRVQDQGIGIIPAD